MPLDKDALKTRIVKEMNGKGIVTEGEFAKAADLAEAIANAVVDELVMNAVVIINKGSSIGDYKIS